MIGKVLKFEEAGSDSFSHWYVVTIENQQKSYLLGRNWVNQFGVLKVGEEIEFEVRKLPAYSDVKNFNFFVGLKRKVESVKNA